MKKLFLLLAVLSLFIASPVLALDSATLMDRCGEAEKSLQKMADADHSKSLFCISYIWGVIDTYESLKNEDKEPLYCLPENDMETYVRTVVSFIKRNPDYVSYNAPVSIIQSFIEAFPCSNPMSTQ